MYCISWQINVCAYLLIFNKRCLQPRLLNFLVHGTVTIPTVPSRLPVNRCSRTELLNCTFLMSVTASAAKCDYIHKGCHAHKIRLYIIHLCILGVGGRLDVKRECQEKHVSSTLTHIQKNDKGKMPPYIRFLRRIKNNYNHLTN
jgi:hypothetical protein